MIEINKKSLVAILVCILVTWHGQQISAKNLMRNDIERGHPLSKYWLISCQDCVEALKLAVDNMCNSAQQCSAVVNAYHSDCSPCADEILEPENLEVASDGEEYIFCAPESSMQILACQYYCRSNYYKTGMCQPNSDRQSICKCYTTTDATFTVNLFGDVLQTLTGHSSLISGLLALPSGHLVSASSDNTIKVWNAQDGSLARTLDHGASIEALAALPSAGLVASADSNAAIMVWNVESGQLVKTVDISDFKKLQTMAPLPDGRLACSFSDNTIKLLDTTNGEFLLTLVGHTNWVRAIVALSNSQMASAGDDNTVRIWSTVDGLLLRTLEGHAGPVRGLAVLPSGLLASASADKTVKIWNPDEGTLVKTLSGHTYHVYSLAVLKNGGLLASGSSDNTIRIWNTNDWTLAKTLRKHTRLPRVLAALPDGNLASGCDDATINIWYTKSIQ